MNLLGPIYLEDFQSTILELQEGLMFVSYFILIAGLIVRLVRLSDTEADMVAMVKPIFICFLLIALISSVRFWFDGLNSGFAQAAEIINEEYASEPFAVTEALINTIDEDPEAEGWGVDRIVNSLYLSVVYGVAKLGITLAALFQVPFYILQYVLTWLGFLFLPIGLSLFIFPSLGNIGVKLISNIMAVMAWPIGFAITNLAAMAVIKDFSGASTFTGNDTGTSLYMMSFGSLIMGIMASLILVIGTLATPTIMFILFSSGAILQGITGAVTGAAAFATYMGGSMGFRGNGESAPKSETPPSNPAPAPASSSTYGSIGGSGGYTTGEPPPAYGGDSSTELGPALRQFQQPALQGGALELTSESQPALPAPPEPTNPMLPVSPSDPTGSQHAAKLFALGTAAKPVIDV